MAPRSWSEHGEDILTCPCYHLSSSAADSPYAVLLEGYRLVVAWIREHGYSCEAEAVLVCIHLCCNIVELVEIRVLGTVHELLNAAPAFELPKLVTSV